MNFDWSKISSIVNSLAGPLVTFVALIAAVMFWRSKHSLATFALLAGCTLIFAQRVIYAFVWLPGLGYFDRTQAQTYQVVTFNNYTVLINLVAWILFVSGFFFVAKARLREA